MYSKCKKNIMYILILVFLLLMFIYIDNLAATLVCKIIKIPYDFSVSVVNMEFKNEIVYILLIIEIYFFKVLLDKDKN